MKINLKVMGQPGVCRSEQVQAGNKTGHVADPHESGP